MFSLYYLPLFRKLGLAKSTEWGVAIRKVTKEFDTILGHEKDIEFEPIKNTREYWFADPLLFSDNGHTWLFVEAFNRKLNKGEIGYFKVEDGKALEFKSVIRTSTHMSYPFVFKHSGEYYMIPETGGANHLALYRAKNFPDDWELDTVLLNNVKYYDSTVIPIGEDKFTIISYSQVGTNRFNQRCTLTVFELDMVGKKLTKIKDIQDPNRCNRPAGPCFKKDGKMYRVSQKCNRAYGEAMYVYEIAKGEDGKYEKDKIVNCFDGKHIRLSDGGKVILTHTYSQSGGYEVVDYRCKR